MGVVVGLFGSVLLYDIIDVVVTQSAFYVDWRSTSYRGFWDWFVIALLGGVVTI